MEFILAAAAIVAVANLVASVVVMQSTKISTRQRVICMVLIWLVPVVGAVVGIAESLGSSRQRNRQCAADPLCSPLAGVPEYSAPDTFDCDIGDIGGCD